MNDGFKCIDQFAALFDVSAFFARFSGSNDGSGCYQFGTVLFANTPVSMHNDRFTLVLAKVEYDVAGNVQQ